MSMCRCMKCGEIVDTDLTEGAMCEDCQADFDGMDLEDQLEELLDGEESDQ